MGKVPLYLNPRRPVSRTRSGPVLGFFPEKNGPKIRTEKNNRTIKNVLGPQEEVVVVDAIVQHAHLGRV